MTSRGWCFIGVNAAMALTWPISAGAQHLAGDLRCHDPSLVLEDHGNNYVFYTGRGIGSKSSPDLLHWTEGPAVFKLPPAWTQQRVPKNNGRFWAPDVAFFKGKFHLYYSVSSFGDQDSAIGLVTNVTLDPADSKHAWTDQGPVVESHLGDAFNAIDPSIVQTSDGGVWLSFGSFWDGIHLVQLEPATGLRATGSTIHRLADHESIEAPFIHERDGKFYLFVNWGLCCRGTKSTYDLRVGRSDRITGPYLDRDGVDMRQSGGTLFLDTEGDFIGPGHISIFSRDRQEWFSYHYYDEKARGRSKLNVRRLNWNDSGWPVAGPALKPRDANQSSQRFGAARHLASNNTSP
jgi:arabinan endo-1,5-alpha-L-arabinosidase